MKKIMRETALFLCKMSKIARPGAKIHRKFIIFLKKLLTNRDFCAIIRQNQEKGSKKMILCYYYQNQITKKIVATRRLASQLPKHNNTEWYDEWELIAKTFIWKKGGIPLTQFFPKRRI